MPAFASRCSKLVLPLALAALLALPACGADPTPTPVPTPTANVAAVIPTPAPTPDTDGATDTTTDPTPNVAATDPTTDVTPTPPPAEDAAPAERSTGQVDGIVFVVSEGSEATFSVGEVLAGVSIPNYEAVMHTTSLTGEVRLDGGASLVTLDLHSMTSD